MTTLSLNGEWRMRQADGGPWREARVPGSVYADLLRVGVMEDPFWRENERGAFELLRHDYEYTRDFDMTEEQLRAGRVLLHCDGLDTLALVSVNGQPVGYANNMHVTWDWDVKPLLHPGRNSLLIHFDSPVEAALAAGLYCYGFVNPGSGKQDLSRADRRIRSLLEVLEPDEPQPADP